MIYGKTGEKPCTLCGVTLPINTKNFYAKVRENGRSYFTAKCKNCIKLKRAAYREAAPEAVRRSSKKTFEKFAEKYNANRRSKFAANPELRLLKNEKTREWFATNIDMVIAYRVAYRAVNYEKMREQASIYARENPEKMRVHRQIRKGRLRGASGRFTSDDITKQFNDQSEMCFWCKSNLHTTGYHADHYIPVAKGGTNKHYNIVLSCPTCNISRGAKMPVEFFAYRRLIADKMPEIEMKREYHRIKMRERRARDLVVIAPLQHDRRRSAINDT